MPKVQTTRIYREIQGAFDKGFTTVSEQGSSRCFGRGTLVRMSDGTLKAVEDITIGDRVMNMQSNGYNTVIDTHSGIDDMYLVQQARGIDYTVNSRHILSLKQARAEKRSVGMIPYDKHVIHDFEVSDFVKRSKRFQERFVGFKSKSHGSDYHTTSIKITPVGRDEYFGFELDDSPYFLLSDGTVCHNSSKTYNTVIWLCVRCLSVPNTTVSIVRATLPSLKGSVFRDFVEILTNMGQYNRKQLNKSEMTYEFPNGSWVEFFSCDNEQKLRGRKRKILYVNEGNELRFLEWQQLQMRTTLFSVIDYNPSFTDEHWLCELNKEGTTKHFITTYKDNPFLESKVIAEIESLREKNPSLWRIYGLGLQAIVEGLIFEKVEVIDEIPSRCKRKRFIGMDFGYSSDPTAIVEVCITDDAIYIDEECYQTKMLSSDIISVLKEKNRREKFFFKVITESADPRLGDEI